MTTLRPGRTPAAGKSANLICRDEFSAALHAIVDGQPGRRIEWWARRMKVSRGTLYNWISKKSLPQAAKLYQLASLAVEEGTDPALLERLYAAPCDTGTVADYIVPAALADLQTLLLTLDGADRIDVLQRAREAIVGGARVPRPSAPGATRGLAAPSQQYLAEKVLNSALDEVRDALDSFAAQAHALITGRSTGEYPHGVLALDMQNQSSLDDRLRRTEFLDRALPLVGDDSADITVTIRGEAYRAERAGSPKMFTDNLRPKLHIVNYCVVRIS
jgi:hypothetical protein